MVFLLMHISREEDGKSVGVKNPWTEYVKVLPGYIPVPTMWTDEERVLLTGTSLEVCSCLYFLGGGVSLVASVHK